MHIKPLLVSSLLLLAVFNINAQAQTPPQLSTQDTTASEGEDELMTMLEEEPSKPGKEYTTATFKTTRIANGHSIENTGVGVLDFRVGHRFGFINQGIKDFFGLDNATTRIAFDYGITNWLMVGVGRSSYLKEYDGFVKAKLLRQREKGGMPFSVSYMGAASIQTNDPGLPDSVEYYFSNRVAYVNQLLIARKFNSWLSLQLMPTHIHYNLVTFRDDPNDVVAVGIGGRLKLSNRISLTGEWYYQIPSMQRHDEADPTRSTYTRNPLTIGLDIETGGHVFQLLFTNAAGITERNVVGQTTGDWSKGDIHFGFNISRVFTIVKPKGFENSRNKIW
jgi:hypothetical protein